MAAYNRLGNAGTFRSRTDHARYATLLRIRAGALRQRDIDSQAIPASAMAVADNGGRRGNRLARLFPEYADRPPWRTSCLGNPDNVHVVIRGVRAVEIINEFHAY